MIPKPLALFSAVCLSALLGGCGYSNTEGSQDSETTYRIETNPPNCRLILVEAGIEFRTPTDIGVDEIDPEETLLRVVSDNYGSWEGVLLDLPRIGGARTYKLDLTARR
ncbi:MAG: hypothetical protein AAF196_14330 [Planctomycetota bacterium]